MYFSIIHELDVLSNALKGQIDVTGEKEQFNEALELFLKVVQMQRDRVLAQAREFDRKAQFLDVDGTVYGLSVAIEMPDDAWIVQEIDAFGTHKFIFVQSPVTKDDQVIRSHAQNELEARDVYERQLARVGTGELQEVRLIRPGLRLVNCVRRSNGKLTGPETGQQYGTKQTPTPKT